MASMIQSGQFIPVLYEGIPRSKSYGGIPPNAPLHKKLNQCRVALITTAGLHAPRTRTPYDDRIIGGDCSYREIPNTDRDTSPCAWT